MTTTEYPILDSGYFHLTATGWRRQDTEPFPDGRLETWRYATETLSPNHKELVHLTRVWVASRPDAEIAAIRHRYGDAVEPSLNRHITLDCRRSISE